MRNCVTVLYCALAGALTVMLTACAPQKKVVSLPPTLLPPGQYSWGDQGDGTYRNPVLPTDFSDPDILRVGKDFYLIASDFHFVGMQIMHSTDLVNWHPVTQIFYKLTMDPKYDQMNGYGQGTWAPSLRYHDRQFFIYVCTPHDGLFMWHAASPAGPWSDTVTVKKVDHWEDPCPFWDDDGQAYLVHSRTGAGPLILHRMSADGTRLLDEGRQIYFGPNAEGPKIFKRHGYYYISLPEKGFTVGCQTMLRARSIEGPYERREVFHANGLHQGGMVELEDGHAWFIAFKTSGFLGRINFLEPVQWQDNDWPVFGDHGHQVLRAAKPDVGVPSQPFRPSLSDDFHDAVLNPLWQWNHNPINDHWSLTETPGELHLRALPADHLWLAHNTLTQKLWDQTGTITVRLLTRQLADGQRAGLTFLSGSEFGYVGVEQVHGERHIVSMMGPPPAPPKPKRLPSKFPIFKTKPVRKDQDVLAMAAARPSSPVVPGPAVRDVVTLRGTYDQAGTARFAYSLDGKTFVAIPGTTTLRYLNWKGARVGLFTYGSIPGTAAFKNFDYQYQSIAPAPEAAPR